MDWNNFLLQLDYKTPFTVEELEFYESICKGLDRQLSLTIDWLRSDEAKQFYHERAEHLEWIWENEIDLESQLDNLINYNSSSSTDEFMSRFYHMGCAMGAQQLKRELAFTPADENTLNFLRQNNYGYIKNLNKDMEYSIRKTIFEDVAQNRSYQETIRKIRKLPLTPVADGKISPDVRARMISRTERARARSYGSLQSYANYGVSYYDLITRGARACGICQDLEKGGPYELINPIAYVPIHPNCYMPDTEVFTDKGWKLIKDVDTEKDTVLTLNPETKLTEFIKPNKLISHENTHGYMYHIYNKWFDICVTPDHDCFVYQRKQVDNVRGLYPEFRKPDELNGESKFLRTVENDNTSPEYVDVNGLQFKVKDYAFFMAWYISEGSVLHNPDTAKARKYPVFISQRILENRRLMEPVFKDIADYLGIKLYIGKAGFEFRSKELHDYLIKLGRSHEKYIPSELLELDRDCLNIFLDNYVLGDGNVKTDSKYGSIDRTVFTSSIRLRDDLSYLILLSGYYPSITLHSKKGTVTKHKNGVFTQNHDVWAVRINRSNYACYSNCTVDKVEYTGEVVCLELPKYHTLWIKYNGKTSWNGNCICSNAPHIPDGERLSSTPVDFPISISDYVDLTMKPPSQRARI